MLRRPLALLAILPIAAFGQTFDEGWNAYESARFDEAVSIFRPLADAGDASAQFALGRMYETGRGVSEDLAEATRWYGLAAEGGHRLAQFVMGLKFSTGEGVAQDSAEAAKWYLRSAEQGYANAQLNVGAMYAIGEGLEKDPVRAYAWWELAASQGNTIAARNRDELTERLDASQIARAKALEGELLTR